MERRRFGPTKREVPVIGQGTWDIEQADRAEAIAALRLGLDLGATHVDTAEMYGDGEAERIVGEAIAGRRDEVFLVSKLLPKHAARRRAIEACEASLRRLRTDHLDVYLLHWRERTPLPETLAAFEDLQRAGKILAWGVSNFDVADLEEMLTIAGEGRCACNQVLYHLRERAIEHAVLPWCERHDIPVVAYSPLGSGRFPGPRARGGKALEHIAAAHAASPRQAALRFLLRRPSLFTIPKAARAEHAAENAAAGDLRLCDADLARLDAAFPRGRRRTLPTL